MEKDRLITNNPLTEDLRLECSWVEGDFLDVLMKVRDLIYSGNYRLVTHPLPASSRMFLSPIRSVVLRSGNSDTYSMELIQTSIDMYQKTMGIRKPDWAHDKDYQKIDYDLLVRAMEEQDELDQIEINKTEIEGVIV